MTTPNNTVAGLAEKWRAEAATARKVAETPKSTESGITLCVIAENMEQLAAELEAALASPAPSVSPAVEGDAGELPELPTPAHPTHSLGPLYSASQMRWYGEQVRRLATPEQPGSAVQGEAATIIQRVVDELREEAHERLQEDRGAGVLADPDTATMLQAWGNQLILAKWRLAETTPPPAPAAEQGWGPSYKQPWQAKEDAEQQECGAIGSQGCTYRPEGPRGEMQCTYCGAEQPEGKGANWLAERIAKWQETYPDSESSWVDKSDAAVEILEEYGDLICRLAAAPAAPGAAVDEAMARRLDDYLGGEFDIRIGKQAAHAALTAALAGKEGA